MYRQELKGVINIRGAEQVHPPSDDVYSMIKYPRGPALIVCVRNFTEGGQQDRLGSEQDVAAMETLLQQLQFDVQPTLLDPTQIEMWKGICEFAHLCHMRGYNQHDECLALVLMSHGNERDEIYGSDGETIPIKYITDLFSASKCPGFAGKPKLFIIQACRGTNKDSGYDERDADALMPVLQQEQSLPQDLLDCLPVIDPTEVVESDGGGKVGNRSDIYIAYSTTEDDVSWRNIIRGSWFIEDLVRAFDEKAHVVEIDSIFRRVNQLVQERGDRSKVQQTPSIKHQLRKYLYFNTKHPISRYKDSKMKVVFHTAAGIFGPFGISSLPNGGLVYTDHNDHSINIVTPQGERRRLAGGKSGSGRGEFNGPEDVVVDSENQLVIVDFINNRLQVLSETGRFIREVKVGGGPRGICVVQGDYYVTTWWPEDQVIRYDSGFNVIKKVKRSEFKDLRHLVHHRGHLYIADYWANIIHVMTVDLEYVRGIGEGKLTGPYGITIDKNNFLLVTDEGCVKVFTLDGEMVANMGEGELRSPSGITTDPSGDKIIVCDWGNNRIVSF